MGTGFFGAVGGFFGKRSPLGKAAILGAGAAAAYVVGKQVKQTMQPVIDAVVEGKDLPRGPLAPLEDTPYKFTHLSYPENVGTFGSRNPFYILFNIFASSQTGYAIPGAQPIVSLGKIGESLPAILKKGQDQFRRSSIRTESSIRLYMPDTINWSFNHNWQEVSLSEEFGAIGKAATMMTMGTGAYDESKVQGTAQKRYDTARAAAAIGLEAIGVNKTLAASAAGLAQNPNMEVLYNNPSFRSFNFEFVFAPRNAEESRAALEIIQTFKFHAAPESFSGGSDLGRFFVPPSEFEIEFKQQGAEHYWQLGKIGRCVLQDISIDYGASGQFATFIDGMPTNIRLTLSFKETEYITKEMVAKGF